MHNEWRKGVKEEKGGKLVKLLVVIVVAKYKNNANSIINITSDAVSPFWSTNYSYRFLF